MIVELQLTDDFVSTSQLFIGINHLRANQFHEAIWAFDNVIKLSPSDKYAHWNRAMALLSLGEYEEGFKEHDWGWRLFDWRGFGPVRDDIDRLKMLPFWDGEDVSNSNLLVYHELGFGDAIQCMRYLPELKRRSKKVTLVINRELISLVNANWPHIDVVDCVPDDLTKYAYRLPFFGVMKALRQKIDNIPAAPYIHPRQWNMIKGFVGVVWSGRTNNFKFSEFSSLFDHGQFRLFSLQPGPVLKDVLTPLEASDFNGTAQVIARMEHIVTVDTGVAHLAGAMGHPSVHVLLPYQGDWRWWHADVWYPRIKTYRQKTIGDWSEPFAELNRNLTVNNGPTQ